MKKIHFLIIVTITFLSNSFCQNDIRFYTPEADFIRNIMATDSNDYLANVDIKNMVTDYFDSTIVLKIGKDGSLIKTLYLSTYFPNAKATIQGKSIKLQNGKNLALCNMYYENDSLYRTGLLYFNDELEVTSIKMMGDSNQYNYSGAMMINSKNQIVVTGQICFMYDTIHKDSLFVREYTLEGNLIKERNFHSLYVNSVQNILELTYYGTYIIHYQENMFNTYIDTNFATSRTIHNGCSGCHESTPWTYQISDKKFIKALWIDTSIPFQSYYSEVGFMIKDTTRSIDYAVDTIITMYQFGSINNEDWLGGLDFVAPDTVYLLYKFIDTTISNQDVYTLLKTTTTGNIIWSKNYACDVNRWLAVEATDNEILLYGRFWEGDNHFGDGYTSNPIIVRLDKEGVVQSTTDINFQQADVLIYPNPTNSILNLRIENGERKFERLKILNMMGQCVYDSKVGKSNPDLKTTIDVSGFTKGTYFLQLIGDYYQTSKKFIVN